MRIFISLSATSPEAAKKSKAALKEYNAIANAIVKSKAKRDTLIAKLKSKKIKTSESPELDTIKKEIKRLLLQRTKLLATLKSKKIKLPKLGRVYINAAPGKAKAQAPKKDSSDPEYKSLLEKLSDVEADMEEMQDDGKTSSKAYKALEEKQRAISLKLKAFKGKTKAAPKPTKASPSTKVSSGKQPTPSSENGPKEKIFYYNGLIRELTDSIKKRNSELEEEWDQMNPKKRPTISVLKRTDKQLNNAKRKIAKYTKMIADLK